MDRPPSIYEVETHREHIRLNLENWEKQWTDVVRYERAVVQDDADKATSYRALTRAAYCLGLAISLSLPIVTDDSALEKVQLSFLTLRDIVLAGAVASATTMVASLIYAWRIYRLRKRSSKPRTAPRLPPRRLDAVEMLTILTQEGTPRYYRERDVDEGLDFGWKSGFRLPPEAKGGGPEGHSSHGPAPDERSE